LASTTKLGEPVLLYFVEKLGHPFQVAGDGMIVQPALADPAQPFTHRLNRPVASLNELHLDRCNRGTQTLRDRFPAKCKPALAGHVAAMREAEKVERFRSAFSACQPARFVDTRFQNPENASNTWLDVTDPREPLFGQRFQIESVSQAPQESAYAFVRREDGIVLRVPLRATSISALVDHAPRAKLCEQSAQEFLSLVKEYALWPSQSPSKPTRSGRNSKNNSDKKS